jgi:glycine betaine/proline transport system substrate-binding protein
MKTSRKLLALILVLAAGILIAGCGGDGGSQANRITLGDIGWDESVAVANLSKVLLEDELDYDRVEIQRLESPALLFQGVAQGELDAFQDVWLPNHQPFLEEHEEDVELLDPWYQGQTSQGVAVPTYLTNVNSLEDLNGSEVETIYGIEPGTPFMERLTNEVVPTYNLEQRVVEAGTQGMLAQVDDLYENREPFAMMAWGPHWMHLRYDLKYLDDPQDAQGELNDPARMATIVNNELPEKEPVAYTFFDVYTLTEGQLNELEAAINDSGDPERGVRNWLENNRDVVEPWLEAARNARGV